MARPGKKRRGLFILEIVVLLLFIGGLFVYGQITTRLDKIEQPKLDKEKVLINAEAPQMTGYKTYAIFGVDSRGEGSKLSASNSDTMIIVTVDNDAKKVKMVSVYRDTLLNVGNDTYTKANAAYAFGGPEQAISMLNTNLDLNITDYATADFSALVEIIDAVGGLDIPMSYDEIEHMNNYCVETSEVTGKSYTKIEKPDPAPEDREAIIGTYHLNGVQATSYCRIRYTSSMDMGRTERQRLVISMIVDKAKSAGITTLFKLVDAVFPMVQTSLPKEEILKLIPVMLSYEIGEKTGFPMDFKFSNVKGSVIVPTSLESNVIKLHELLYGTAEGYTPSAEVSERSNKILDIVGGTDKLEDAAAAPAENETETDDTFIWTENGSSDGSYGGGDYDYGGNDYGGGDYDGGGDYGGNDYDSGYDDSGDYGGGDYDGGYDDSGDYGGDYDGGYDDGGDYGGDDYGGGDDGSYDDSGEFSDGYATEDGAAAEGLSEQGAE